MSSPNDIPFEIVPEEPVSFETESVNTVSSPVFESISTEFFGSWTFLVSQTNWEKGRIIHEWRTKLMAAGAPHTMYTDDTWARQVRNVSSQHIGRLRRVYEQFDEKRANFTRLYWSHFQAALDWESAEEWLEKAAANHWSVATMRIQRWEAIGAPPDKKPFDTDITDADLDEDVNPRNDSNAVRTKNGANLPAEKGKNKTIQSESSNPTGGSDDDEDDDSQKGKKYRERQDYMTESDSPPSGEILAKLRKIQELPEDLRDAFEQLKVAILGHKITGWKQVAANDVLAILDQMKLVVTSL